MHDQTPTGSLSSLVKLEERLKTYGLLKSIRESPDMWRPVFVPGCAPTMQCDSYHFPQRASCCPTTSTCDLRITIPTHLDNEDDMNSIMASALGDSESFGLI